MEELTLEDCDEMPSDDEYWFGHWLPIWPETNEEKVRKDLKKWKQVVLSTYPGLTQIGDDHWIERVIENWFETVNTPYKTIALKICLKGTLPDNVERFTSIEIKNI